MRKGLIALAVLGLLFAATPAFAQDMMGTFSAGIGGGFGEEDLGPFVISAKYWDPMWEVGAEILTSFEDESMDYDQLGLVWIAYRYDVTYEEDGAAYVGIGGGGIFNQSDWFENQFGPVAMIGWDADIWGLEFKYGYFDPSLFTIVAYYHFNE